MYEDYSTIRAVLEFPIYVIITIVVSLPFCVAAVSVTPVLHETVIAVDVNEEEQETYAIELLKNDYFYHYRTDKLMLNDGTIVTVDGHWTIKDYGHLKLPGVKTAFEIVTRRFRPAEYTYNKKE